jgi:hypothetical protein
MPDVAVTGDGPKVEVRFGGRQRAEDLAARLSAFLGGARMSYGEAGRALGVHPNRLRYAAATGTVLIRWAESLPLPGIRERIVVRWDD